MAMACVTAAAVIRTPYRPIQSGNSIDTEEDHADARQLRTRTSIKTLKAYKSRVSLANSLTYLFTSFGYDPVKRSVCKQCCYGDSRTRHGGSEK